MEEENDLSEAFDGTTEKVDGEDLESEEEEVWEDEIPDIPFRDGEDGL